MFIYQKISPISPIFTIYNVNQIKSCCSLKKMYLLEIKCISLSLSRAWHQPTNQSACLAHHMFNIISSLLSCASIASIVKNIRQIRSNVLFVHTITKITAVFGCNRVDSRDRRVPCAPVSSHVGIPVVPKEDRHQVAHRVRDSARTLYCD